MTERYCEGERFADLSFTEEAFEDCHLKDAKFSLPEAVNLLADLKIKLS